MPELRPDRRDLDVSAFPMILIAVILYNLVAFRRRHGRASRHAAHAGPQFRDPDVLGRQVENHAWATCSCCWRWRCCSSRPSRRRAAPSREILNHAFAMIDLLHRAGGVHCAEGIFHLGLFPDHRHVPVRCGGGLYHLHRGGAARHGRDGGGPGRAVGAGARKAAPRPSSGRSSLEMVHWTISWPMATAPHGQARPWWKKLKTCGNAAGSIIAAPKDRWPSG